MTSIRQALALLAAGAVLLPLCAQAQDDVFNQLKSYDSQHRAPVAAIYQMIRAAGEDKARDAAIEQQLDAVLEDPNATFAGKEEAGRMLWIIGTGRSVPVLAKMLDDEKLNNVARYALERNADPSAGRALRSALPTAKGDALIGLINSIGDRADPAAVGDLKPLTTNPDAMVAAAAIAALGKIGTDSAVAALDALPADNSLVSQALVGSADRLAAAGQRGRAERIYLSLLKPDHPEVARADAVKGLALLGSARAPAAALSALQSPDTYLQTVAADVAGAFTDSAVQQAIAAWPTLPITAQVVLLQSLADHGNAAAAPLALQATQSTDALLRTTGIRAAGRVGGPAAVPRLVELAAKDGADGGTAREVLALMPGDATDQAILQAARTGSPDAQAALMRVLADRATPASRTLLLADASSANSQVAVEAIKALGRIGGTGEDAVLVKLLASTPNDNVRDAAKDALTSIGQRLGEGDPAAAALLAAMPGATIAGKIDLLALLADTGSAAALDALTTATTDANPDVKNAAIAALADSWPDTRPLPTLAAIAKNDPGKSQRVQALRGYIRLVAQSDNMAADQKVARLTDALALAERPEEKRQILSALRDVRTVPAMELASKMLDDPELFDDAASTVVYLAGQQRKNRRNQPAVTGPEATAALDKVIQGTKDDNLKAEAVKLKG